MVERAQGSYRMVEAVLSWVDPRPIEALYRCRSPAEWGICRRLLPPSPPVGAKRQPRPGILRYVGVLFRRQGDGTTCPPLIGGASDRPATRLMAAWQSGP